MSAHISTKGRTLVDNDTMFYEMLVRPLMIHIGKNPSKCEQCDKKVKTPYIHHTKYQGATLYDLQFVCRRCNSNPKNVGLA